FDEYAWALINSSETRAILQKQRCGFSLWRTTKNSHANSRKAWRSRDIPPHWPSTGTRRSEEHTSELQSLRHLVCRLLLEKKYRGLHVFALRHCHHFGLEFIALDLQPRNSGLALRDVARLHRHDVLADVAFPGHFVPGLLY